MGEECRMQISEGRLKIKEERGKMKEEKGKRKEEREKKILGAAERSDAKDLPLRFSGAVSCCALYLSLAAPQKDAAAIRARAQYSNYQISKSSNHSNNPPY